MTPKKLQKYTLYIIGSLTLLIGSYIFQSSSQGETLSGDEVAKRTSLDSILLPKAQADIPSDGASGDDCGDGGGGGDCGT